MMRRREILSALAATTIISMSATRAISQEEVVENLVEMSRDEAPVVIYSSWSSKVWGPVISAFNEEYPWIEIQSLDLNVREIVERYYAEANAGIDTASLVVTMYQEIAHDFGAAGELIDYFPPEAEKLPEWSMPAPGAFTVSVDPTVMVWNKLAIEEENAPRSFGALVELVTANPEKFSGKIATYPLDLSIFHHNPLKVRLKLDGEEEAWKRIEIVGPASRLENSTGSMIEKIVSGEYLVGYFAAASPVFTALADPAMGRILDWSFVEDGTVLSPRLAGIPAKAASPASAKLFLNFVISEKGQRALATVGRGIYHPDIDQADLPIGQYTLNGITDLVGEENVVVVMDPVGDVRHYESFMDRLLPIYSKR